MGNNYSLKKISKYLDKEDKNILYNHNLVFNTVIFHNVNKRVYYNFRFEFILNKGQIMIDRFICDNESQEWLYDKIGILPLLKLYNGIYKYDNLFNLKNINEGFYKFVYLFIKDPLCLKVLLACKNTTYKEYINNLKNEEGESIENYQRRTLKEIVGENY